MREVFNDLDIDGDGLLGVNDIEEGIRQLGICVGADKVKEFFSSIDKNNNGRVDFEEFKLFYEGRRQDLKIIFEEISSSDNKTEISVTDVSSAINGSTGLKVTNKQMSEIMVALDKDKSGTVTFDNFLASLLLLPTVNVAACFEFIYTAALNVAQGEYTSIPQQESSSRPETNTLVEIGTQLYFGGIAGVVSRCCCAPIDRIKVLAQAAKPGTKQTIFKTAQSIYIQGGVKAFFRGNFVNCTKIGPETGTHYNTLYTLLYTLYTL